MIVIGLFSEVVLFETNLRSVFLQISFIYQKLKSEMDCKIGPLQTVLREFNGRLVYFFDKSKLHGYYPLYSL